MMLPSRIFLLAAVTRALPGAVALSLLETHNTSFGAVFVYGDRAIKKLVEKRDCGDPIVVCDSENNVPDRAACESLVKTMEAISEITLPDGTIAACAVTEGHCCTTWGEPVPSLRFGSLVEGVKAMLNACNDPDGSAKYVPADLQGVCTLQCLDGTTNGNCGF